MSVMSRSDERSRVLRREFDESFAAPPAVEAGGIQRLLAIAAGGHPYALPLAGVRALLAGGRVVPLPTSAGSFLGVTGHRGLVVPVFDLAAILGYPASAESRWIALIGTHDLPVGLAFERFEAQLQLPEGAARPAGEEGDGRYVSHVVVTDGAVRPVLNLTAVLEALPRASVAGSKGAMK